MGQQLSDVVRAAAGRAFDDRRGPARSLADDAERVALACHDMAIRFHRGGTLIVFGNGGSSTDAQHISVEFVHPVIVGKRALPSISLTNDVTTMMSVADREGIDEVFSHQLRYLAAPDDIALGVSSDGGCENVLAGLSEAKAMDLLTVALVGGDGGPIGRSDDVDHVVLARSDDPRIVKEIHVTVYHVLWELVHVFFEQPGVLSPGMVAG